MFDTAEKKEKAILIGLINKKQDQKCINEYLDELEFLIDTAGGEPGKRFIQALDIPDSRTYIGSGKLDEIKEYVDASQIDVAVFDDELTPSQIRNIENVLQCKVLDRTTLILDIFARRAHTAEARTQVELAQYQYLLPRLTRMWTHLTKQRGGMGMRGPGEKEIETDRRIIRKKISLLKEKLETIDKQRTTQRSKRADLIRVALVGYTNVGKSTIMNLLSKSDVFAENKLFATLDTTVRKVVFENLPFLLTDTIGFIRKLPHGLIKSFKSTLDEVREADILLHVVDISHSNFEEQIEVVKQTLLEISVSEKPTIVVFNKIDVYKYEEIQSEDLPSEDVKISNLNDLKKTWMSKINAPALFISAKTKQNVDELKNLLYNEVKELHRKRYPYENFLY
jgi:GTP-binding protein HflX